MLHLHTAPALKMRTASFVKRLLHLVRAAPACSVPGICGEEQRARVGHEDWHRLTFTGAVARSSLAA
jgi:hypothetical protein